MKYEVINAVCETENFTKAAKKLNYSQSAVSQAVRNFEKELGITLFERSKKGVKPLEEVRPIIESIRKIHEEEEKMKECVKVIKESDSGVVKIAYLGEKIEKWFWGLFQSFGETYPKIHCEIRKKTPYEVEKDLENRVLDFAFSFPMDSDEFGFLPYGEEELLVFLQKGHKLASKESISMYDLEKENIIITSKEWMVELKKLQKGVELQNQDSQFYFSDESMALKLVEQGRGICILPRSFDNISKSTLKVEAKSFEKKYYRTWGLVYPRKENLSSAAKKFLDHVFCTYKKYPDFVDSAIGEDYRI